MLPIQIKIPSTPLRLKTSAMCGFSVQREENNKIHENYRYINTKIRVTVQVFTWLHSWIWALVLFSSRRNHKSGSNVQKKKILYCKILLTNPFRSWSHTHCIVGVLVWSGPRSTLFISAQQYKLLVSANGQCAHRDHWFHSACSQTLCDRS